MDLLAAEITARTGRYQVSITRELTAEFGTVDHTRIDVGGAGGIREQKARLEGLLPEAVKEPESAW